jgi:methyl-accepting chemotaxis protein
MQKVTFIMKSGANMAGESTEVSRKLVDDVGLILENIEEVKKITEVTAVSVSEASNLSKEVMDGLRAQDLKLSKFKV